MSFEKCCCSTNKQYYDYIIVGNGTTGAVLARKLSDNYKNRVLVLEIGRNRTDDPIVKSPNVFSPAILSEITFNPKYSVSYAVPTYSTTTLQVQDYYPPLGQAVNYTEGRMWGGSSAHHYLLAVRGTPPIYDQWALLSGNNRWTYNNLLATMKRIETYTPNGTPINLNQRGTNGPVFITQSPPVTNEPIIIGLSAGTDTPFTNDYNDPVEGFLSVSANQQFITPPPNSERSYSQSAYLQVGEIIDADGNGLNGRPLKIISAALVSHVIFDKKRAIGVEYIENYRDSNSRVIQVYAMKKVILSAGSINTPAILQRSGVGDAALLNELGIPVVVNSPNVGKNLVNHYGPIGTLVNVPQFAPSNGQAFVNGAPFLPDDDVRRIQIIPQFFGPTVFGVLAFILNSASRGLVKIVDTNPVIEPLVDLNMYSDPAGYDASVAVAFYKLLQLISAKIPGSIVVYPTANDYLTDEGLLRAAKNISTSAVSSHASSTTQMAKNINDGVVDGNLHVFGTTNLMIADLGVAPIIPDGNTAFAAFVIGEVASHILLNEKQFCHCNVCKKEYREKYRY